MQLCHLSVGLCLSFWLYGFRISQPTLSPRYLFLREQSRPIRAVCRKRTTVRVFTSKTSFDYTLTLEIVITRAAFKRRELILSRPNALLVFKSLMDLETKSSLIG